MHAFGASVGGAVKTARARLQKLFGAEFDHEIVFTAGGTESDNMAILSALESQTGRDEIVTSAVEHPAVLSLCAHLEKSRGIKVHVIPVVEKGLLDIEAYRAALSDRVAIVSIMWANNETGTIFPVAELAELAKEVGALFHTDAVQAVGKIPMDFKSTAIDMLSLSGHKLHGPKGIGALYVPRGVRFRSLLKGGHQERGRRAGTENTPGIVGLGMAAELALEHMTDENTRVAARARTYLERAYEDFVVSDPLKERVFKVLEDHDPARPPTSRTPGPRVVRRAIGPLRQRRPPSARGASRARRRELSASIASVRRPERRASRRAARIGQIRSSS